MEMDDLIESIRKEEVALVIGSGLSLYAGYIGVNELKALIREKAEGYCPNDWEKASLAEKNLEDLAEILIRYTGSREELNQILVNAYKKPPLFTHTHDHLSRIPHFEHIFTTNYDTLIEGSMERRCHVIGAELSFPIQSKKLPKVYKLHGDVNNLQEVVIARSDYTKNILKQKENLLWNRFIDVTSSKDILFIGHSNEDSNFWGILEGVSEKLKGHQKRRFFIAPNIPAHQQANLKRNGFVCFLVDADQFLNILYPKLVECAATDLESGLLSIDTFQQFLSLNDRNAIIRSEDSQIRVEAITRPNGLIDSKVKFSVKEDVYKEFLKFSNGTTRARSFSFSANDLFNFDYLMNGYKLALSSETLRNFEVMLIHENRMLDIESADGQIELASIPVKQYNFPDGSDIELEFFESKFTFSFKFIKKAVHTTLTFKLPEHFTSVKDALGAIEFIHALFNGKVLNFYFDGKGAIPIQNTNPINLNFNRWPASILIGHFKQLREIERKFHIRFGTVNLAEINQTTIDEVNYLSEIFKIGFVERILKKVILLPAELRKYGTITESVENITTLVLEESKCYHFYGINLPVCYAVIDVLDSEFVRDGETFGIKSKSERIRHRLLTEIEYQEFQNLSSILVSVAKLEGSSEKNSLN